MNGYAKRPWSPRSDARHASGPWHWGAKFSLATIVLAALVAVAISGRGVAPAIAKQSAAGAATGGGAHGVGGTLTTTVATSKNASGSTKTAVTYGTANFTIKVTNTGNTILEAVTVTDALSPDCNRGLGDLAPGASRTYICMTASVKRNFTNIATADGTSPKGTKVTAVDHAVVKVTIKTTSTAGAKFTG